MVTLTLKEMAERARACFEHAKREDGSEYWRTKESTPEWVKDLCHEAHRYGEGVWNVMLPDDHRYAFIVDALDALESHDDADEAMDSIEPSIFNHELHAWLASRNMRSSYVDDARSEGLCGDGDDSNLDADIAMGQLMEMREVFSSVRLALDERIPVEEEMEEKRREHLPLIWRVPAK